MLSSLVNSLIPLAIIVAIVIIVVALIKAKYKLTLLCFVGALGLLFSAYTGYEMYSYYSSVSSVRGSLEEHDPYEDFNFFEYNLTDFAWYTETETDDAGEMKVVRYYYQTEYATSIEFDGETNKFVLLINDKPCKTSSTFGRLRGEQNITFYNVDGEKETKINVCVDFVFYANRIDLKVETDANTENIGFLNEYMQIHGFKMRILYDPPYKSLDLLSSKIV